MLEENLLGLGDPNETLTPIRNNSLELIPPLPRLQNPRKVSHAPRADLVEFDPCVGGAESSPVVSKSNLDLLINRLQPLSSRVMPARSMGDYLDQFHVERENPRGSPGASLDNSIDYENDTEVEMVARTCNHLFETVQKVLHASEEYSEDSKVKVRVMKNALLSLLQEDKEQSIVIPKPT